MKRIHLLTIGVSVLLAHPNLFAQASSEDVAKIVAEARQNSQVMAHLDHLTNHIGPRLTSSDNLVRACEWAKEQFESFGLEARLEKWDDAPVGFNRGPWFGRVVEPVDLGLIFNTMAWSWGTKGTVRGEAVLSARDREEFDKMKGDIAGKWIVRRPGSSARPVSRDEAVSTKDYEDAGVAGVIHEGQTLLRTSGQQPPSIEAVSKLCRIFIIKDQYDQIVEMMENGKNVVLEFNVQNRFRKGPIPLYNVIADLKGTEKPDEYVIVGGHIDSWDGATGTTDNGTGVSTTMEAARLLTTIGAKPKRTIRFMLWSGEEQGLLGSSAHVRMNGDTMPKISAVFVHDMGTNYLSGVSCLPSQVDAMNAVFAPVLGLSEEMPFQVRETNRMGGGGSDHASFIRAGVPGFFWNQDGKVTYGFGWHTQNDYYDLAIPEYQQHSSMIVAIGALGTANLPEMVSREGMADATARGGRGGGRGGRGNFGAVLGGEFKEGSLELGKVADEGWAKNAGLKAGDKLVRFGDDELEDMRSLFRAIRANSGKVKLTIERSGKEVVLDVDVPTFGRRN